MVHECTSNFSQHVLRDHLGEDYDIHKFEAPADMKQASFRCGQSLPTDTWLLSQNMFGWPALRPRCLGAKVHQCRSCCWPKQPKKQTRDDSGFGSLPSTSFYIYIFILYVYLSIRPVSCDLSFYLSLTYLSS